MKKLESTLTNMALVLTSVSLIAGASLGYMNKITAEPIRLIEAQNLNNGIKKVIIGGIEGDLKIASIDTLLDKKGKPDYVIYKTEDSAGKYLGTAVKHSENGFGGALVVLSGFDESGNILGYEVLAHTETPGLGAQANDWFRTGTSNVIGKNPANPLIVSKDGGDVDAITASTITSRAFLRAVNASYNAIFNNGDGNTGATKHAAEADSAACAADSIQTNNLK